MESRQWREQLCHDLRRQRLPAAYIDRLVEELADHVVDSQQEHTSMDAQQLFSRMGSTEQLATVAGAEFRRRTFAGRHPVLTFVFGPLAVTPAVFVALFALLVAA